MNSNLQWIWIKWFKSNNFLSPWHKKVKWYWPNGPKYFLSLFDCLLVHGRNVSLFNFKSKLEWILKPLLLPLLLMLSPLAGCFVGEGLRCLCILPASSSSSSSRRAASSASRASLDTSTSCCGTANADRSGIPNRSSPFKIKVSKEFTDCSKFYNFC